MQTVIVCSRCEWERIITPNGVVDEEEARKLDLRDAEYQRRQLRQCPRCRDINLGIEQRDLFGRVLVRRLADG